MFERRWALSLLEQVMAKLGPNSAHLKRPIIDALFVFLNGEPEDFRYDKVGDACGCPPDASPGPLIHTSKVCGTRFLASTSRAALFLRFLRGLTVVEFSDAL